MFYNLKGLKEIINLNILNTSEVTNMSSMFYYCSSLTGLNLSGFYTSKVTSMNSMFSGCSGLTSLDLSKFNTSNITNMYMMFNRCSSLTSLDLSGFDASNVTDMQGMFQHCDGLTSLDVTKFVTTSVTSMNSMFSGCSGLTSLDLSSFDTSKVTNMSYMFQNCSGLTSLDLSKFNTSNITNMYMMFNRCSSLTSLDLSSFDTSKVTDMGSMFSSCSGLTSLDVSGFDTSNITNMYMMFSSCRGLTTIYVGSKWSVASVTNSTNMFFGCTKLVGAVAFDSTKIDASMANYDTGYLTLKCFASDLKRLAASSTVIADDGTIDHNMRYTGISPNNYVTFNGEEWRVIGSFNNVDDGTGKKAPRVKIIKSESIGDRQWHTSSANIWKSSSLNTELQTLSYTTNSMVDNAVWYLGDPGGSYAYTAAEAYTYERGTTVVSGNDVEWTGKVGLMYPSDYGYASSGCKDGLQPLYKYNESSCYITDWLFLNNESHEWLLNPFYGYDANARYLNNGGFVAGGSLGTNVNKSYAVRPVVYLKSDVVCNNCSDSTAGSQSNPFQIA